MISRALQSWAEVGIRVTRAREAAGLSIQDLAGSTGLTHLALAGIESGRRPPVATDLSRLAEATGQHIDWFVIESPPQVVSRRSELGSSTGSNRADLLVDNLARDVELLNELNVLAGPAAFPALSPPETFEQAEQAARGVRDLLQRPDGPLLDLQRLVEGLGLWAFSISEPQNAPEGAYISLGFGGIAWVNGVLPSGRRRFTLAHELGHHVFQDAYATDWLLGQNTDDRERLINAFAVHALLPRSSVTRDWEQLGGAEDPRAAAIELGVAYRVSWTVICNQLSTLKLIDGSQRAQLVAWPPTRGDFVARQLAIVEELEPISLPSEYAAAVIKAYRQNKISSRRAIELLRQSLEESELPPPDIVPVEALKAELQ